MAAFHLKDISAGFNKYTDNLRGLLFNHPEHLESFRRRKARLKRWIVIKTKRPEEESTSSNVSTSERAYFTSQPKQKVQFTLESQEDISGTFDSHDQSLSKGTQTEESTTETSNCDCNSADSSTLKSLQYEEIYLQEILNFMNGNKVYLEKIMLENDKNKVDKIVEVAKNMRPLINDEMKKCEFDILELLMTIKYKWMDEVEKLK